MKIKLVNIDNNPHRNMRRNPVNAEQVKTLMASIQRNEWGENVIVRKHPDERGRYQLAYGHHRLAALRKLGITEAEFIVKDIDDWGMYTWMVDENESQKTVTPELIYENIEAGINFLEPAIRRCETAEEFGLIVYRHTISQQKPQDYARIRNAVLSGEGLGRSCLSERNRPNKTERVVRELAKLVLTGRGHDPRALELAQRVEEHSRRKAPQPKDDR
jgi:hypothetical protein